MRQLKFTIINTTIFNDFNLTFERRDEFIDFRMIFAFFILYICSS